MEFTIRKDYSESKISQIKKELAKKTELTSDICVVVTGSFGRNEASEESDMDWFIVSENELPEPKKNLLQKAVTEVVEMHVTKNFGNTGTFGGVVTKSTILGNFGGDSDSNTAFTRRILYVLESKPLFNDILYKTIKKEIIEKYIKEDTPDNGINRFILNDIIRYYRTICTDYEFKVHESGKSWGVRKIKLKFSRKLLYFSGLITVAATANYTRAKKIEKTLELLQFSPIERIEKIISIDRSKKIIDKYNYFLKEISKPDVRASLDSVDRTKRHQSDTYRELKNMSHHFGLELEHSMHSDFPPSHPIHSSLIF